MGVEFYKGLVNPALARLDSETWHNRTKNLLDLLEHTPYGLNLIQQLNFGRQRFSDERLRVDIDGIRAESPLFVGPGWTKNGEGVRGLIALGYSGVEVGTVVLNPQIGNQPLPRQEVIIINGRVVTWNWLGFNQKETAETIGQRLNQYSDLVVGGNVGINKDVKAKDAPEALAKLTRILIPSSDYTRVKFLVLNHSSPNTVLLDQDTPLRRLLGKEYLMDSAQAIISVMSEKGVFLPFLIKLSPDMSYQEIDEALVVAIDVGTTGVIMGNTTTDSEIKRKYYDQKVQRKYGERFLTTGGIAGDDPDFRQMLLEKTAYIYLNFGNKLMVWGAGAVNDAETAYQRIKAGASILEVISGNRAVGPTIAGRILRGLIKLMEQDGLTHISQAVGVEAREVVSRAA
ncbi:hypothetical protein HYS93_04570 [Candidatus Daviesbacteria bacterium]|nr:hypothetical protein [Candidatus Daviesbacteria bacterium]